MTTSTVTKTVTQIIREVIRDLDTADGVEIMDEVIKRIDPVDYEQHIRALGMTVIPNYLGSIRNSATKAIINMGDGTVAGGSGTVPPSTFISIAPTTPVVVFRSAKRDRIRAAFQEYLDSWVPVASGEKKRIRDLDLADVRFQATKLRGLAKKNADSADRWDSVGDTMETKKAKVLSDLDDKFIQNALKGEI